MLCANDADVRVPAGATRVRLAGKTVMPMIIDTHVLLSETREALIRDAGMTPMQVIVAVLRLSVVRTATGKRLKI